MTPPTRSGEPDAFAPARGGLGPWGWPFSFSDLTAGLRKYFADPTLAVVDVRPMTLPFQKPAIGRVRGLEVDYRARRTAGTAALVVKEPAGSTRIGLAGVGRTEVGVYTHLAPQLPVAMPKFVAGSPHGDWIIIEAIPIGQSASRWGKSVFFDALDALIRLHDRFWGLREDLGNFAWLTRPLEGDFDIYLTAANHAIDRIIDQGTPASLAGSPERLHLLKQLTEQAAPIAAALRQETPTLLHGDYWPGNIAVDRNHRLVVYDWQLTGIGPPILDLLTFAKKTEWWFPGAAVSSPDLVRHYRAGLEALQGARWDDATWDRLWDLALLWRFLQEWLDLLAAIPESLLVASSDQLEKVWLDPVAAALRRQTG